MDNSFLRYYTWIINSFYFVCRSPIRSDYETTLSIRSEMNILVPKFDRIGFGSVSDRICTLLIPSLYVFYIFFFITLFYMYFRLFYVYLKSILYQSFTSLYYFISILHSILNRFYPILNLF